VASCSVIEAEGPSELEPLLGMERADGQDPRITLAEAEPFQQYSFSCQRTSCDLLVRVRLDDHEGSFEGMPELARLQVVEVGRPPDIAEDEPLASHLILGTEEGQEIDVFDMPRGSYVLELEKTSEWPDSLKSLTLTLQAFWLTSVDSSSPSDILCPSQMVFVRGAAVCVDQYEASVGASGVAESTADMAPWAQVTWYEARNACEAAGKRLCKSDEWLEACLGPLSDRDYLSESPWESGTCALDPQGGREAVLTGSRGECEGGYDGLFDMVGNLSEWTSTCVVEHWDYQYEERFCQTRGGSFDSAEPGRCTGFEQFISDHMSQSNGFRCCRDI